LTLITVVQPIPPTQIHAFYGADAPNGTVDEYSSNMAAQTAHLEHLAYLAS